jgi:hypothetical protein
VPASNLAVAAIPSVTDAIEKAGRQPYEYRRREPDWRRLPGCDVVEAQ